MARLNGKIAIVTGGASGLGVEIARRLVEEGAKVMMTDIQRGEGERVAEELGCAFAHQDVASESEWIRVIEASEKRFGGLHILVNNAGIEGTHGDGNPENTTATDWRLVQKVNVEGVFLGCRYAIPAIARSGGGTIINVSSTAALGGTPECVAYGASKAAVRHLTTSVALHCAKSGSRIRCNSIHPGLVLTPMLRRILGERERISGQPVEVQIEELKNVIPQGEFQEPGDVAAGVVFLASDEAKHITGIGLVIDGGCTLNVG